MHKLAWTLDACLKDRVLDARRLKELSQFLSGFDCPDAFRHASAHSGCLHRGSSGVRRDEGLLSSSKTGSIKDFVLRPARDCQSQKEELDRGAAQSSGAVLNF